MKQPAQRIVAAAFFIFAALGYLLSVWPLSLAGVVLMALWGRWFLAVIVGLLLDLAWGAPLGLAHFLYFPFTIAAVVAALARLWGGRYFIDRNPQERL